MLTYVTAQGIKTVLFLERKRTKKNFSAKLRFAKGIGTISFHKRCKFGSTQELSAPKFKARQSKVLKTVLFLERKRIKKNFSAKLRFAKGIGAISFHKRCKFGSTQELSAPKFKARQSKVLKTVLFLERKRTKKNFSAKLRFAKGIGTISFHKRCKFGNTQELSAPKFKAR